MIDASPTSATANSYTTVEEATTFLTEERLFSDVWIAATEAEQERALLWARYLFESMWTWKGSRVSTTQPLQFPRYLDGVNTGFPTALRRAQAEVAMLLLEKDPTKQLALLQRGFKRAKADVLEVTLDKSFVPEVFPQFVRSSLVEYGELEVVQGSTTRIVKLERS